MGKVTQLIFGGIAPGHVTANLMAANITSGASSSSADLLVDLKVGYLLGANPRKQFIAQFSGIFLGTLVSVLAFRSMVPDANALQAFNAPGARTWAATAEALGMGFSHLHSIKVLSIIAGGILGLILVLIPRYIPRTGKWLPTPSASAWPGPSSGTTPSSSLQELCSAGLRTIFQGQITGI